ncbi:MAG: hypothetical protein V4736_10950 [Bdellovibrionota bacterium]
MKLKTQLPKIYQVLLVPELLEAEVIETKATCNNCSMSPPQNKKAPFYKPDLKCCTYYPYLPNYLVGGILRDKEKLTPGLKSVMNGIIKRRQYALPIGIVAPVSYQVPFNQRKEGDFGQRADWLCPYFQKETSNCGIWEWRGGVCSTFFCQSNYGSNGLKFWGELNEYLNYVEMALMEEALVQLDFSPRQISDMLDFINRKEGDPAEMESLYLPEKKARALWNGYFDDQEGFYLKCLEITEKLDRNTFEDALGNMGKKIERTLLKKLNALKL